MRRAWLNLALVAGLFVLFLSGLAASAGCRQGAGDLCQVDRDCSGNLVCNPGTGRCQRPGTPDAGPDAGGGE